MILRLGVAVAIALLCGAACSSGDSSERPGSSSDGSVDAGDAESDAPPIEGGQEAEASSLPVVLLPKTGLDPDELGVLVNANDPASVEIADYYVQKRGIPSANVVELAFTPSDVMSESDFAVQKALVDALPATVQGLVITWTQPYRVGCMSVTSAFALGFDQKYCNTTGGGCGPTASIDYFDSLSVLPFADHGIRPAMMLAAKSVSDAKALIDRGVSADDTHPTGDGYLLRTTDDPRSVRWPEFVALTGQWDHPEVMQLEYIDNSSGTGQDYIDEQE